MSVRDVLSVGFRLDAPGRTPECFLKAANLSSYRLDGILVLGYIAQEYEPVENQSDHGLAMLIPVFHERLEVDVRRYLFHGPPIPWDRAHLLRQSLDMVKPKAGRICRDMSVVSEEVVFPMHEKIASLGYIDLTYGGVDMNFGGGEALLPRGGINTLTACACITKPGPVGYQQLGWLVLREMYRTG